jgi:DNA-binding LytR/AlgR family response regulator
MESTINVKQNQERTYKSRYIVSKGYRSFVIKVTDIACFVFEDRVTNAVLFNNQRYMLNQTLAETALELNPQLFFKANRKTIINIEAVHSFESYFEGRLIITLNDIQTDKIIISRVKSQCFKRWLDS